MNNFSISTQIKNELEDFETSQIILAKRDKNKTVRYLRKGDGTYLYNQSDVLSLIDLYYSSQFETGFKDSNGQRKIFMNIGKFRTEVSAKQIDIDTRHFRFLPDDYSNPYAAFFMGKEFKEWAKESDFADLINDIVENYPKYGTVVLKKVGSDIKFVHLQNLKVEQTAESLQTASYVIEEHADMKPWEILAMKNWDTDGISMRIDDEYTVYERYGYVPKRWLKNYDKDLMMDDAEEYVDAMVVMTFDRNASKASNRKEHIFYAREIKDRPYREKHWSRQHGRWLGVGVMEDQIPNQQAKNIAVNLIRKSLHWSAKKMFQAIKADASARNLVTDVRDGDIIEVGANGEIKPVATESRGTNEIQQLLNEFEKNSDQKAFTYEVTTGENMPSGTPFRLGVVLSEAANSYFGLKKEKLGLFLKGVIIDFMIPKFIQNVGNKDHIITFYSDEPGYNALQEGVMELLKSEAIRTSLFNGKPVDVATIETAIDPARAIEKLFFNRPKGFYQDIMSKTKFDLVVTGESIDLGNKLQTLTTIFEVWTQRGDPRAEQVLNKISALVGENPAAFAQVKLPKQVSMAMNGQQEGAGGQGAMPQVNPQGNGQQQTV